MRHLRDRDRDRSHRVRISAERDHIPDDIVRLGLEDGGWADMSTPATGRSE